MINIELENKVTEALNNLGKINHNNVPRDIDDLISDFYSTRTKIFKNITSADMSPELMERIINKLSYTTEILSEIDDDYIKGMMNINLLISDFDRLDNSNFMYPVSSMGYLNIIGGYVGPGKSTVGNTKHYSGMKSGEMSSSGKVRILPDFFDKSPDPAVTEALIRGVKSGISYITTKDEPPSQPEGRLQRFYDPAVYESIITEASKNTERSERSDAILKMYERIIEQPDTVNGLDEIRKYIIDDARFLKELENDIIESFDVTHTSQKSNTVSRNGILHLKKLVKRPKGRK